VTTSAVKVSSPEEEAERLKREEAALEALIKKKTGH
jgi:hypothetical protein